MRILAVDTALSACSVCVLDAGAAAPAALRSEIMDRGHAEALMPMLADLERDVPGGFAAIDKIAVTVGPGSFTGLRVGLAAARAMGVGLGIPVVGVGTLAAFAAPVVASDGTLTIHPIRVDRVPRRWVDADGSNPRNPAALVPGEPLVPALIERPIVLRPGREAGEDGEGLA